MRRVLVVLIFINLIEIISGQDIFPNKRKLPNYTFLLYSGVFIPTQSASVLGNHGIIGWGFGGSLNRNSLDFLINFKFGPPKGSYEVLDKDSLITTNKYRGMYLGLEYSRTLLIRNKSEYYISVGYGAEYLSAFKNEKKKRKVLVSPSFNLGIGYSYRLNDRNRFSIQFRYKYLDFENHSGTELTGNSYIIKIIWINEMPRLIPGR